MPVSGHVSHWSPVCGTSQMSDELAREGQIRQATSLCGKHSRPRSAQSKSQKFGSGEVTFWLHSAVGLTGVLWCLLLHRVCSSWVSGWYFLLQNSKTSLASFFWVTFQELNCIVWCVERPGDYWTAGVQLSMQVQMQRPVSLPGLFLKYIGGVVLRSTAHWTREVESCSCVILLQNKYSEQKGR